MIFSRIFLRKINKIIQQIHKIHHFTTPIKTERAELKILANFYWTVNPVGTAGGVVSTVPPPLTGPIYVPAVIARSS
jgi:hypothetical protein